ncbi:hypothetical protein [Streptomyces sp. NPDC093089]|uniref:hypothetical protein n=1 Tax=Streptomyces sp. NPDC093089 TaxID=3366024 RepID=UPI003823B7BC
MTVTSSAVTAQTEEFSGGTAEAVADRVGNGLHVASVRNGDLDADGDGPRTGVRPPGGVMRQLPARTSATRSATVRKVRAATDS